LTSTVHLETRQLVSPANATSATGLLVGT